MARGMGGTDDQLQPRGASLRSTASSAGPLLPTIPDNNGISLDPSFKASETELMEYTYGQCHALALALHRHSGWRLAGCNWSDDQDSVPGHIFVVDDDDRGVDIHGSHPRGRHPDPGIDSDWRPITVDQVRSWINADEYDAADHGRADYTAELMLGISDTIILPA